MKNRTPYTWDDFPVKTKYASPTRLTTLSSTFTPDNNSHPLTTMVQRRCGLPSTRRRLSLYWFAWVLLAASLLLGCAAGATSHGDEREDTSSLNRQLASLAEKWNITGPTFGSNQLEFQLNYTVSDFIIPDMIQHQLYDSQCAEGGVTLPPSILTAEVTADMSVPAGLGDDTRQVKITITIDPETISETSIYSEEVVDNQVKATIVFCHRFMLFTSSETPIEVNFRETVITSHVDLTDGSTLNNVILNRAIRRRRPAFTLKKTRISNLRGG